MSARGRFLSGLVTVVMASAGFVTVGALPAAGTNSGNVEYFALGDSYAAGQATGSYPNCLRSPEGYPALLDSEKRIDLEANIACSGAKTSDVATNQLAELNRHTRLVTLTVGAADLGLSGVLAVCNDPARTQAECLMKIAEARALLQAGPGGPSVLGGRLVSLFADVAERAPRARVVVTGYPHLFEPLPASDPRAAIVAAINSATDALNSTIEQAVSITNDADVNINYVDVTEEFAGHGIFSAVPFINNLPDQDAFHPNAAGYRAYAGAISAVLPHAWLDKQKQLV